MKVISVDITELDVAIIVNAANSSLRGGGGVDGAIHRAAGFGLLEECIKLGGCETGEAKMTNAYNLPSKKIIHTVGPIYKDGNSGEKELLSNCYKNSMLLAEQYRKKEKLKHIVIAFPCISTGVFGYPKAEACDIAVNTIKEINNKNIEVLFVCFKNEDYELYDEKIIEWNQMEYGCFPTKKDKKLAKLKAKKYRIKCPNCGSKNALKICYGEPDYELWNLYEKGEVFLGGCIKSFTNPEYHCKDCHANIIKNKITKEIIIEVLDEKEDEFCRNKDNQEIEW